MFFTGVYKVHLLRAFWTQETLFKFHFGKLFSRFSDGKKIEKKEEKEKRRERKKKRKKKEKKDRNAKERTKVEVKKIWWKFCFINHVTKTFDQEYKFKKLFPTLIVS